MDNVDRGKKRSGPSLRAILMSDICGYIRSVEMSASSPLRQKQGVPKSNDQAPASAAPHGSWRLAAQEPLSLSVLLPPGVPHVRVWVVDGDGVDGELWMVERQTTHRPFQPSASWSLDGLANSEAPSGLCVADLINHFSDGHHWVMDDHLSQISTHEPRDGLSTRGGRHIVRFSVGLLGRPCSSWQQSVTPWRSVVMWTASH
ncbi:hypothetical protein BKA56DRAFT_320057 [Ilyonectria sp. MPI-CAGE-AT-0026]|nr:hypothetical protein BKA56DRAFT_320057 [Ilyonectria sp. MPI-CAGE-AT-0026]